MAYSKYSTKHAFLSEATSPHTINLILNLIYKDIIKKTDLLLIIYGAVSSNKSIKNTCQAHGIQVLEWDKISSTSQKFLTLNCLSLQPTTAKIIINCLNTKFVNAEKVNVLITDDEIDRWLKLYKKTGKIISDPQALVDDDVLKVMDLVNNYIVPDETWGGVLREVLERDVNIIDAVLPFNVLDYKSQQSLEGFLNNRKKCKDISNYKILLFTKYKDQKKTFNIITSYLSKNLNIPPNTNITIGLWIGLDKKGIMLYAAMKLFVKIKKIPVTLKLEQPVSSEQYALMLYEYDCLILQERGGFSTAKYFAENIGKVITLENSFNDKTFKLDYKIETFNSKTYVSALRSAVQSIQVNEKEAIRKFANLVSKRHDKSFEILKQYWSSF